MKKRYPYVSGLLIALILCALLAPTPAQAQQQAILRWAEAGKPGTTGNVIVSPSEVSEIAIGSGGVFYAIDSVNNKVYRSLNAGVSWNDITLRLTTAGAVLPATKIVVAPDSAAMVAAVTNGGARVYLSIDGGFTWSDTGALAITGTIQTIAISKLYTQGSSTLRDIAIGTAVWNNNTTTGQLWVAQFGDLFSPWSNQSIKVDPASPPGVGGEVSAIAYSPNFQVDRTILVIASTASDVALVYQNKTWLCIGRRDTTPPGTTTWNAPTDLPPGSYPVEVGTLASPSAGDAPGVLKIVSSLALPSDYNGSNSWYRRVFASYDRQPSPGLDANDDAYRLDDSSGTPIVTRLNVYGSAVINIASLAYYGTVPSPTNTQGGKLLAGDVPAAPSPPAPPSTVYVRSTTDPFDTPPSWALASQPPTGPGNAKVGWSSDGSVAYCGTSTTGGAANDESAFSRSLDYGVTWEQISLIDTSVTLLDVAVAPSPPSLFLATVSLTTHIGSVWRSGGELLGQYWARVRTINTTSDKITIRLSPNYSTDYTLYAAEIEVLGVSSKQMAVSYNRGNSWYPRSAPGNVVDLAVANKNTVYVALDDGRISKSTNGAWLWESLVATSLTSINMLSIAPGGTILAGGISGDVAYSTDGGASFTHTANFGAGNVWVVADTGYKENGIIYAGNGNRIYRKAIGSSSNWQGIRTTTAGQLITGLAVAEGVLYGAWYDVGANKSGVERCLGPTNSSTEWDTMDVGAVGRRFDVTPSSLQVSSMETEVSLWAIHNDLVPANRAIMVYDDTLAKVKPSLSAPENAQPDPVSGRNSQFVITWPAVSTGTEYEVEIYADAGCTALVLSAPTAVAPAIAYSPPDVTNPGWVVGAGQLTSNRDYYLRLRVRNELSDDKIRGLWSAPVKFTVTISLPVTPPYIGPLLTTPDPDATNISPAPGFIWAAVPGATEYELILAEDIGLTQLVAGTPVKVKSTAWQSPNELDYSTTYFWRVRASAPLAGDWSSVSSFTTMTEPSPPPTPPPVLKLTSIPPRLLWLTIGIITILLIGLIILTVRTGR